MKNVTPDIQNKTHQKNKKFSWTTKKFVTTNHWDAFAICMYIYCKTIKV